MKNKLIIITGCSGGGKSTLSDKLKSMGNTTIPEAGRIVNLFHLSYELNS